MLKVLLAVAAAVSVVAPVRSAGADGGLAPPAQPGAAEAAAVAVDDECSTATGPGGDSGSHCALNALQLRGQKALAADDDTSYADEVEDDEGWLQAPQEDLEAGAEEPEEAPELRQTANASFKVNAAGWALGPPSDPTQYNGIAWQEMIVHGAGPQHVFAIGDWGGLLGSASRAMVFYKSCRAPGPHTFPRSRGGCKMPDFQLCFNTEGAVCSPACGWIRGIDDQAQMLVANQMKQRAATSHPSYVLNVGDNFYQGGIWHDCGHSMNQLSNIAHQQFSHVWQDVYGDLANKPWLSVLGNHDWGGWQFNHGWDQQVAYTWANKNWIMPALYFSQRVSYPDSNMTIDYFMLDSNAMDAKEGDADAEHNICGPHNPGGANCGHSGGPPSKEGCYAWFWKLWREQQKWLEKRLDASDADWQVVVTHFPCGFQASWFKMLHKKHGLDLLVSGHRHDQELWPARRLGGLACFITGGGGGITSEGSPYGFTSHQYGFFDLTFSKQSLFIESINFNGLTVAKQTVHPTHTGKQGDGIPSTVAKVVPAAAGVGHLLPPEAAEASCAHYGCAGYNRGQKCQCNADCARHRSCCSDFQAKCAR